VKDKSLRVSLVQTDLVWLGPDANLQHLTESLSALSGRTDLIVLPEMFTSGFTEKPEPLFIGKVFENKGSDNSELGDKVDLFPRLKSTAKWMLSQAKLLGAAVTGSIAHQLEGDVDDGQP